MKFIVSWCIYVFVLILLLPDNVYHTYPYGVTNINLVNGDLTIAGLMDGYILCERDKCAG